MKDEFYPFGIRIAVISKLYHGALGKRLEHLEIDRYFTLVLFLSKSTSPLTQQKIAEELQVDKTAMVRVIDYLTEKGYVQRESNPSDRRAHFIQLTDLGRLRLLDIEDAINHLNNKALTGLDDAERKNFYKQLGLISQNLSSEPVLEMEMNYKRKRTEDA